MELLDYLLAEGTSVSYAIRGIDQKRIYDLNAPEGKRFGILFTFAQGNVLPMDTEDTCFRFGREAANLHIISEGFDTVDS